MPGSRRGRRRREQSPSCCGLCQRPPLLSVHCSWARRRRKRKERRRGQERRGGALFLFFGGGGVEEEKERKREIRISFFSRCRASRRRRRLALAAFCRSSLSLFSRVSRLISRFRGTSQFTRATRSPSGAVSSALGELEASSDALPLMLPALSSSTADAADDDDVCSNDGAGGEADAVPSFRPVLRPPRRVRLRTREEEAATPPSSCLPPCSGGVGRVSRGRWKEDDEAEAAAALVVVVGVRRPSGVAATTRGAAVAPPTKDPTTREAPRAACKVAIRVSGFRFLAERERASSQLTFVACVRERERERVGILPKSDASPTKVVERGSASETDGGAKRKKGEKLHRSRSCSLTLRRSGLRRDALRLSRPLLPSRSRTPAESSRSRDASEEKESARELAPFSRERERAVVAAAVAAATKRFIFSPFLPLSSSSYQNANGAAGP